MFYVYADRALAPFDRGVRQRSVPPLPATRPVDGENERRNSRRGDGTTEPRDASASFEGGSVRHDDVVVEATVLDEVRRQVPGTGEPWTMDPPSAVRRTMASHETKLCVPARS